MKLGDVAADVGKGRFAGVVGTAAMTESSTLEMKMRGRPASNAPADAAGKMLGVEPKDEWGEARFSTLVHRGYGTEWGAVRGHIGAAGLKGPAATAAHLGAVWGRRAGDAAGPGCRPALLDVGGERGWHRRLSPPGVRDRDERSLRPPRPLAPADPSPRQGVLCSFDSTHDSRGAEVAHGRWSCHRGPAK